MAVLSVLCPGSQNDVSVYGNLLFLASDSIRTDDSCASTIMPSPTSPECRTGRASSLRHLRQAQPRYRQSVETDCGSHTQTLVPGAAGRVYVYVSSYELRPASSDCTAPHDRMSIVEVQREPHRGQGRGRACRPPRRREPGRPAGDAVPVRHASQHGLPRHHGVPGQGPRGRCLHG